MSVHPSRVPDQGGFTLTTAAVSTQQLVRYAGASGDFNPIHYDQAHAVEAGLGGVIAHGMLTMGFMARAVTDWAGERGQLQAISARFTAPVRPGDQVRVDGTYTCDRLPDGDRRALCRLGAWVATVQVATGEATVLLPPD